MLNAVILKIKMTEPVKNVNTIAKLVKMLKHVHHVLTTLTELTMKTVIVNLDFMMMVLLNANHVIQNA
jgi:hypothetical protein